MVLVPLSAQAGAEPRLHDKDRLLPKGLMFGHAGLAVIGFVLLLIATFGGGK